MSVYRFRFFDKNDRVIAGQFSSCADDDAARHHADILTAEVAGANIQIWCNDRQVPRTRKENPPPGRMT